ncbi:MAG: hypothetical protein ACI4OS_08215 [Akkermansia sp.]
MKRLLFGLALAVIFGCLFNVLFLYRFAPSRCFWRRCAEVSDRWAEQLRTSQQPCYIFIGGSETRTAIDPAYLKDHFSLSTINAAEHADMGGICHYLLGEPYMRRGDTVVATCAYDFNKPPTISGLRFVWTRMGYKMFREGNVDLNYKNLHRLLSGEPVALAALLIKGPLPNEPIERYDRDAVIHPSGWMEVLTREEQERPAIRILPQETLQAPAESFVAGLCNAERQCRARGCRLLLRLQVEQREENARVIKAFYILHLTRRGFRILKEEALGCDSDAATYADTLNHLSAAGVRKHNAALGRALAQELFWTEEELITFLRERGWDDQGHRAGQKQNGGNGGSDLRHALP